MKQERHSSLAGRHRRNKIAGAFASHRAEMLASPSWKVSSLSARRVLDRVALELCSHGGHVGDGLPVTYADFEKYGVERHCIAPAIREAVALGFLQIMRQGRGGNADFRSVTLYRPTYLQRVDGEPTDEWKHIKTVDEAKDFAKRARAEKTVTRNRKPERNSPPTLVRDARTENSNSPHRFSRTAPTGKSPPLSISRGGGGKQDELPNGTRRTYR
jgi:hypothetical protein